MKKIIYSLLFSLFFITAFSYPASAENWKKEYSEEIISGLYYKKILSYDDGAFSMLHVIESDWGDASKRLGVMIAKKGASYLENTKKMAENYNALAAVNGDFFNVKSPRTNTLGVIYQDGEMVSSPSKDVWATVAMTDTGKIIMDYFMFEGKITAPNEQSHELYQINKMPPTAGAISMFTPKWGDTVVLEENMHALSIKDGYVTGRITTSGEVAFGENDTMLVTNYSINQFFDNFEIGDEVLIEYSLTGNNENIKEALGGNSLIVADGKRASFTHTSEGYAQRTAIGVNKDETKLYLVVAEGRSETFKGFTQKGFADALIELGCHRAVNLDGGGSSAMVVKNEISGNHEVKNGVSSLRAVSTSLGLFNNLPFMGDIKKAVCIPSADAVLTGDYLDIYYKFYDSNEHLVYPQNIEVLTDNPADKVVGNRVYFSDGGNRKVTVTADGVSASAEVFVIADVFSAELYPENIKAEKGKTVSIAVTVWDKDGRKAYVNPEAVKWIKSGVTISGGTVSGGVGYIGADFGRAKAYASVNGGKSPGNVFADNRFMNKSRSGEHIRISAGSSGYSTIADMLRVINYEYTLAGADMLYMLNAPVVEGMHYSSVNTFSQNTVAGTAVMTFDSASGKISSKQMQELLGIKGRKEKNVIIIMKKSPSTFSEAQREMFLTVLEEIEGKNIFLVYEDINTRSYCEDGIYYIGLKAYSGADKNVVPKGNTVDFYISGDDLSYSF